MSNKPTKDEMEFIRLELSQAIETFRSQFSLMIQIGTVFVIANVTLLGYGISSKSAGIFFVSALIPLVLLYAAVGASRFMLPVLYTAIILESKYKTANTDWLASTFVAIRTSTEYVNGLLEINKEKNYEERLRKIKDQKLKLFTSTRHTILLFTFSFGQVIAGLFLYYVFNWQLF